MATLFLCFVAMMAAIVTGLLLRYVQGRRGAWASISLGVWLVYVGCLGASGALRNTSARPPAILLLAAPVVIYLGALIIGIKSSAITRIALAIPLGTLVAVQAFRIGVELFLHQLWAAGMIPKMLTFSGANIDIYVGLSAPIVAWICTRQRWGREVAIAWNVIGLLALANVVSRAVLSAPGPLHLLHTEVPNLMFATFPYMYVPAFFVPLAVTLHVLALRALTR